MQMNPFNTLAEHQAKRQQQTVHLIKLAEQWNGPIQTSLAQLARTIWPNGHTFGLIPTRRYRLRQRFSPGSYVWWIEHDIPPYDHYWCAAYRVELTLDQAGRPSLTVQSGTTVHPVRPLTQKNLTQVLAQAGADLPLLIPRQMGRVDDP